MQYAIQKSFSKIMKPKIHVKKIVSEVLEKSKTAFITSIWCFASKRISFGLSGALSTFKNAMNTVFRLFLGKGVFVYLYDITVMAATFEKHLRILREVFTLL